MKEFLEKIFRPTVVAIVVRYKNGVYQFGTHISMKAFAENPHTNDRSTVQGGVRPGESLAEAMARELSEEYGDKFADACRIVDLGRQAIYGRGRSGVCKKYHHFWIWAPEDIEPELNEEVYQVFWDPDLNLNTVCGCMSEKRAKVVLEEASFLIPD